MGKTPILPKAPPKPKAAKAIAEAETTPFESTKTLIYRQEFERTVKFIDERIANTNFIMSVIIAVLFIGFITLLITVIGIYGQYVGLKINSEAQIINSLNEIKKQMNTNQVNFNLQYEKKEATPTGQ